MADVQLNVQSIVTTSATTAPAQGTSEAWTVTALAAGIPALSAGDTYALVDVTTGASAAQQAELVRVTACDGPGDTSITVTRGVDGTTPVAHAATSTWAVVTVASFLNKDYTEWSTTTPASPSAGLVNFTRYRARRLPAFVGPSGQDSQLQPATFSNRIAKVSAAPSSTTPTLDGLTVTHLNNATATPAAVVVATSSFFTSMARYRCSTTATAGTGAGTRSGAANWMLSSTANKGGFFFVARFGFNLIAAGSRFFTGMSATSAALNPAVDPSTLLSQVGFGFDAGDANLQFMRNDASGTSTKVDLGASFAKGTGGTYFYEVRLFAPSGAGTLVFYSAQRLNDGVVVNGGSVNTDLPAVDTLLSAHVHLSNGAVAAAHSVDIQTIYVESDN